MRQRWLKWTAIVVGLGPATVIGTPGLMFLVPFTLFLAAVSIFVTPTWAAKVRGFHEIFPLGVFALVSAAGLGSLWLVILLGIERVRQRTRLLWFVRVAIVAGVAEVANVCRTQPPWAPPHDWHTVLRVWVLLGPVVVGCHLLYLLSRQARASQAE